MKKCPVNQLSAKNILCTPLLYSVVMQYPPDDHLTLPVWNRYLTSGFLDRGIQCGQAVIGTIDSQNQERWRCEAQNQVGPHDRY